MDNLIALGHIFLCDPVFQPAIHSYQSISFEYATTPRRDGLPRKMKQKTKSRHNEKRWGTHSNSAWLLVRRGNQHLNCGSRSTPNHHHGFRFYSTVHSNYVISEFGPIRWM